MLLLAEAVKKLEMVSGVTVTSVDLVSIERGDIEIFVVEARNLGNTNQYETKT